MREMGERVACQLVPLSPAAVGCVHVQAVSSLDHWRDGGVRCQAAELNELLCDRYLGTCHAAKNGVLTA